MTNATSTAALTDEPLLAVCGSSRASISDDCTLCHSILAFGDDDAFAYLEPTPEKPSNGPMHEYLREEFLASTRQ